MELRHDDAGCKGRQVGIWVVVGGCDWWPGSMNSGWVKCPGGAGAQWPWGSNFNGVRRLGEAYIIFGS